MVKETQDAQSKRFLASPEWPEWIDEHRIDDERLGLAYENAGSACRAAIKTAIAMYFRYDDPAREIIHEVRSDPTTNFWRSRTVFPAPWAIIAFTPRYSAAARLLAALMPALIAGVPRIAAVCVDGMPTDPVMATLDLAGIDTIVSLSSPELAALMEETQPGPGRLVLLHEGELDVLRFQARTMHVPVFEERRPPVLTIPRPELFQLDVLRFAQGESAVARALESPAPAAPDVLYAAPDAVRNHCLASIDAPFSLGMAPLALAPGCEGFWLHHGLGRSFFLAHRVGYGLTS